ncbi:MAG: hypothetical protein PHY92_09920 [Alphaproteobacteria bacterium]|nr:hypothetical protein [Alphaproteobacteria bacterium]
MHKATKTKLKLFQEVAKQTFKWKPHKIIPLAFVGVGIIAGKTLGGTGGAIIGGAVMTYEFIVKDFVKNYKRLKAENLSTCDCR